MPEPQTIVRRPGEGHLLLWLGNPIAYVAIGEETNDAFAAGWGPVPPGRGPKGHVQYNEDEGIYVLEGGITVIAGNRHERLREGDFANIRPGTPHYFVNTGKTAAQIFGIFAPSGFEEYQLEVGKHISAMDDPPDDNYSDEEIDKMRVLAHQYRIDMYPGREIFQQDPDLHLTRMGEGPEFKFSGVTYRGLVTGAETDDGYTALEADLPATGRMLPQRDLRATRAYYVLDGSARITTEETVHEAEKGWFCQVPNGVLHSVESTKENPARLLVLATPSGMGRFLGDAAKAAESEIGAVAAKHDIEIVLDQK